MICIDTNLLIWGVQGSSSPGQEQMVERTQRYLRSLEVSNEQIMIPTPALAEYLQGFEPEPRKHQLEILARHFFIAAFDLPAAYLAAGIARKAQKPKDTSRQLVKTDIQIIATAMIANAKVIITNDTEHFEKLAAGRIPISEVPDVHEQSNLDFDAEP